MLLQPVVEFALAVFRAQAGSVFQQPEGLVIQRLWGSVSVRAMPG
jgi:hypothetical protein